MNSWTYRLDLLHTQKNYISIQIYYEIGSGFGEWDSNLTQEEGTTGSSLGLAQAMDR